MHNYLLSLFLILASIPCTAQKVIYDSYPEGTSGIFINDVRYKAAPGASWETGDILVREGRIAAVGRELKLPPDVRVIEGDSLYTSCAFISLASHAGLKKQKENGNGEGRDPGQDPDFHPGDPPAEVSGSTPWVQVEDQIDWASEDFALYREQGFALIQVFPEGRMIPGQGAVISTAGMERDESMYTTSSGLYAKFDGASRGNYPYTLIGVMAYWRDLIYNARIAEMHRQMYRDDPTSVERPDYSREVEAMIPTAQKQQAVYFLSPDTKTAHRAAALKEELELRMVLTDLDFFYGDPGFFNQPELHLALSLAKPDPVEADSSRVLDPELVAALRSRRESFQNMRKNFPNRLDSAGIAFGFSSLSAKPKELLESIQSRRKDGLSEEALLDALTTWPAQLLGLEKIVGTIEKGKIAHLLLSDKPVFEEGAAIRYLIVEGKLFEFEKEKDKKIEKEKSKGDRS